MAFDLQSIQAALQEESLDGWLLYDFRGSNPLANRILQRGEGHVGSRRCVYGIPAQGDPIKIVHRIEESALNHLPGEKFVYLRWQEFEQGVRSFAQGRKRLAMEYSPRAGNPYVSRVDAGTVELVRSFGPEIVSSGDLISRFEAVWDEEQWETHQQAAVITHAAYDVAWGLIAREVREQGGIEESAVQAAIMQHFHACHATTYSPPIVARGPHSGLPHYKTGTGDQTRIVEGDLVLIDLWAKLDRPRSVYSDLTRVGFVGSAPTDEQRRVFQIVAEARDAGIAAVRKAFASGQAIRGAEIDDVVRAVIAKAGYGEFFTHRTGHSIGREVHGNGANIDHLEIRDDRRILPGSCFSIEPGVYLKEFGIRSEVDVFVDWNGQVHVTGGMIQEQIIPILSEY